MEWPLRDFFLSLISNCQLGTKPRMEHKASHRLKVFFFLMNGVTLESIINVIQSTLLGCLSWRDKHELVATRKTSPNPSLIARKQTKVEKQRTRRSRTKKLQKKCLQWGFGFEMLIALECKPVSKTQLWMVSAEKSKTIHGAEKGN